MRLPRRTEGDWDRPPITLGLIGISGLVFFATHVLGLDILIPWLTYTPIEFGIRGYRLEEPGDDWWRYLTPTLLHFSWLHFIFNALWLWEFGRRIETFFGGAHLFGLFLVGAVAGNGLQYQWAPGALFGGMSGVVYTLIGCLGVLRFLRPEVVLGLPDGILVFMLIWLVLGLSGFLGVFGMDIANGAHVGGLLSGLLSGLMLSKFSRSSWRG